MFVSPKPCSASSALSRRSTIPAWTVTWQAARSTDSSRAIRDRSSSTPSVRPIAVKEWPLPIALTRRPSAPARVTSRQTSSVDAGCSTAAGDMLWLPAQFRHMPVILPQDRSHGAARTARAA